MHQNWRPIPGRFKDYIAMPKPNLYQSLHTTVVGHQGQPFEVQIRTREMDLVAEEGIAAHWRYKEGKIEAQDFDPNILWLRQLLEWQKEVQDPRTFLTTLKVDLYPDEVYVFTPQGRRPRPSRAARRRSTSPTGCTPNSATTAPARASTAAWCRCAPALQNGDMVEILTNPARNPEPRLADLRHHVAGEEQDPPVAQHAAEAAGAGDRPAAVREGDAEVRDPPKKVLTSPR